MKKGDDDDEEESEATLGLEQKGEKLHCEELKFDFCLMLNYMHIFILHGSDVNHIHSTGENWR